MKEQHIQWYSPILGGETQMLVFGHSGYPIIIFPTSMGRYFQNKDFKLIDSVEWFVDKGKVKLYCVDSVDELSWYNKKVHPSVRVQNHLVYDHFLREEIVPRALAETGFNKVGVAGCSFGAYHSANFAFRYPEKVGHLFSMGGAFDIKPQMDGYYNDQVYFNNPPDYIGDLQNPALWEMGIVLGTSEFDICLEANQQMSDILNRKGVKHWLDIRPNAVHDWPVWREMFPQYLSQIKY